MSAAASHDDPIDPGELAELRLRAYGPDAEIADDPVALARLNVLEERIRGSIFAQDEQVAASDPLPAEPESPSRPTPNAVPAPTARPVAQATDRGRVALLACAAVAAVVVAGIAWNGLASSEPAPPQVASLDPADGTAIVEVEDQRWSTSSAAGYTQFLDHLRDELLATPGLEDLGERVIFDALRPFGGLFGRQVWAGPTIDGEYCMVIENHPEPITGCIAADPASSPLTIVLPARRSDSASTAHALVPPGDPVGYTLQPGGMVVAAPQPAAAPSD